MSDVESGGKQFIFFLIEPTLIEIRAHLIEDFSFFQFVFLFFFII